MVLAPTTMKPLGYNNTNNPPPTTSTSGTVYTPLMKPWNPYNAGTSYSAPTSGSSGSWAFGAPSLGGTTSAPSSSFQLYNSFRSKLGAAPQLANDPRFAAPQAITGLGQDYFNRERDRLKEQLRQDFFGANGTLNQVASGESAAGRLGSGVGQQIISDSAIDPYMRSSADMDAQFQNMYLQEQSRVQEFNATQMGQYQDRLGKLMQGDQQAGMELQKLALDAADAQAGRLSQQSIAQLEADLRVWEAALTDAQKQREYEIERQKNMIQYIGTPIKPSESTDSQYQLANSFGSQF